MNLTPPRTHHARSTRSVPLCFGFASTLGRRDTRFYPAHDQRAFQLCDGAQGRERMETGYLARFPNPGRITSGALFRRLRVSPPNRCENEDNNKLQRRAKPMFLLISLLLNSLELLCDDRSPQSSLTRWPGHLRFATVHLELLPGIFHNVVKRCWHHWLDVADRCLFLF